MILFVLHQNSDNVLYAIPLFTAKTLHGNGLEKAGAVELTFLLCLLLASCHTCRSRNSTGITNATAFVLKTHPES